MRVAERLTAMQLKTLEKNTACGVVPGLYVTVRKLPTDRLPSILFSKIE